MPATITSPLSAAVVGEYHATDVWRDQTIYEIVSAHATDRPNATALRSSYRNFTWFELISWVDALAADLASRGLKQGETVFVGSPNRMETVVALLSASRDGYVCCPSPHRNHTVSEIANMCERAACAAYLHEPGHGADAKGDEILTAIGKLKSLRHIYRLGSADDGVPFAGLLRPNIEGGSEPKGNPDFVTYLAFTSGSTGQPKGVMHSDNSQLVAARGITEAWSLGPDTVTCSLSPLSHNLGCGTLWTSLVCGGEFLLHDWPRGESLVDHLEAANVTYLVGVPTHAMDFLADLESRGIERYDRLESFRVSGAACPEHVSCALYDLGIPVQKGYGMTETNGHQHGRMGDSRDIVAATSGVCCDGYELGVFDPNDPDREVPIGTPGLIAGKGGSLMLGYFNDPDATALSMNAGGWFLTGDLGKLDEEGYLTLTGRRKELILRGGHNINPNLIESLALSHEAVYLAAAIPVPDSRLGERVCLAVMFEDGHSATIADILDHLADEGLSRYDMPEFWLPVSDIPLMPNGKLDKLEIQRRIRTGDLVPQALT
ncbi:MAG: Short-chain-fatty-acid--CoA ligase [Alphaproteobacteria bacterium MarineAlpha11_Bin1]|nr:MAG: Short-chain-fatty-acid--CoA ligase [Alphaproteobacteria bacterium MarineAlpha11_Bin1]|tara:strand:- start:10821 stop:12461 length:1641 start_codon:yes stop_codon:yes gene_type:complete